MLRGLPCRSVGLVSSSGAGSTASPGCCSPVGSYWTGSATSSYATSGSTSIEKNDAMHKTYEKMQCEAMQCNTHTKNAWTKPTNGSLSYGSKGWFRVDIDSWLLLPFSLKCLQ